ncbi:GPI-GlcNAc transferase complex [Biscogniauxia marginata]|nr:GPI-GlcNAc transferase complex [Biscogniauxia marginata]
MLTTAPYLRIRRPSPTTAEFTVSTLPPLTAPLRILLYALNLARVVLGLSVLLLLYSVWALSPYHSSSSSSSPSSSSSSSQPTLESPDPNNNNNPPEETTVTSNGPSPFPFYKSQVQQLLRTILTSTAPGRLATRLASSPALPAWALVPLCLAALYLLLRRIHTEESILVLRGLGIQTSSSGTTTSLLGIGGGGGGGGGGRGGGPARFIPTEKIRDVLINEAFRGFEVRSYLVVIVDGEEDVVVVFPRLLPGARIVEKVWRGVRECLYEEGGSGSGGGGGGAKRGFAGGQKWGGK